MLQAIERYMKQALVDKVPAVASAALVSSLHLMQRRCADVVRKLQKNKKYIFRSAAG